MRRRALALCAGASACVAIAALACDAPPEAPTYYKDVAPILAERCVGCHRQDGAAPFRLDAYADAKAWAAANARAVREGRMPPWPADDTGECPELVGEARLDEVEIAALEAWADSGAPAGDAGDLAATDPAPRWIDDASVELVTEAYVPDPTTDEWRCFVLDAGLSKDRFLTAYAVGAHQGVHHVQLWEVLDDGDAAWVAGLDGEDALAGFSCPGWPGLVAARYLTVWGPSDPVRRHPPGTGVRLTAGKKLVMQVHYHLAQEARPIRLALGLADEVEHEAELVWVSAPAFVLPPHQESVAVRGELTVEADALVWGVRAHMHGLGASARVTLQSGDAARCMLSIPRWDAAWQLMYFYRQPLLVQAGDTLRVDCNYSTTSRNVEVAAGPTADDEMCFGYFYVTRD